MELVESIFKNFLLYFLIWFKFWLYSFLSYRSVLLSALATFLVLTPQLSMLEYLWFRNCVAGDKNLFP